MKGEMLVYAGKIHPEKSKYITFIIFNKQAEP